MTMNDDGRKVLAEELYKKGFGPTEISNELKRRGLAPAIPRTVKNWLLKSGIYVSNPAYQRNVSSKSSPKARKNTCCALGTPTCLACCPTVEARARFKKYGITDLQFVALLDKQRHRCAICERVLATLAKADIHVDHCHLTGKVRGVLCKRCNTGLFLFEEQTTRDRAMEYVLSARGA